MSHQCSTFTHSRNRPTRAYQQGPTPFLKAHVVQGTYPRDAATANEKFTGRGPPSSTKVSAVASESSGCTYRPKPSRLSQRRLKEEAMRGTGSVLCDDMRCRGNGHKLTQDVLSHFYIVLCNHQCFLNVLVRVSLTHEELDLTADLRVGLSCHCTAAERG